MGVSVCVCVLAAGQGALQQRQWLWRGARLPGGGHKAGGWGVPCDTGDSLAFPDVPALGMGLQVGGQLEVGGGTHYF